MAKSGNRLRADNHYRLDERENARYRGRDEQLTQISSLLCPGTPQRLVTLVGRSGAGKTDLATEAIRRVETAYSGAVCCVRLTDLKTPVQLPPAILHSLPPPEYRKANLTRPQHGSISVPISGSGDAPALACLFILLESIAQALASRPFLLLLDHFEHLLTDSLSPFSGDALIAPDGAGMVATLLARVPELKCLVTSRRLLDLEGETEIPVFPLPTSLPNPLDATPRSLYTPLHG